ncbi:unnamed protein product [Spirodela intermedia]|uniref:Uncharacterized protein n=1 Tax=Spirodela intermedia TaxID=51605 RepID=A0A7I8L777_SPIIN|nr:unnamed protein product [Spirodela intermedia]
MATQTFFNAVGEALVGKVVNDVLPDLLRKGMELISNYAASGEDPVRPVLVSTADLVGVKQIVRHMSGRIRDFLDDDNLVTLGIHGRGGVGKTTLLERVNNNFHDIRAAQRFHYVIFVTVSRAPNIREIQKQIVKRLDIKSTSSTEYGRDIFRFLSNKRFLLLLDDVWEELNLHHVGVPTPCAENKCKIILTSRSKSVCCKMGTPRKLLEMKTLSESEAWILFKKNVGGDVDLDQRDQEICRHAEAVAKKCGGLPLALKIVGRTMATAVSVGEWREAERNLHLLEDMEEKVLSLLKFSFDRLRDDTVRECLLYCCLFKEDENISIHKLIHYWIAEGFLDSPHSKSISEAQDKGHRIISSLISASLLQKGHQIHNSSRNWTDMQYSDKYVKVHDVVREMCLWLTSSESDKYGKFLLYPRKGIDITLKSWTDVRRVSLCDLETHRKFVYPNEREICPNLATLLLNHIPFGELSIPTGFLQKTKKSLRVLTLKSCNLMNILEDISSLQVLRYLDLSNTKLPRLSNTINFSTRLQYLDISKNELQSLPDMIGKLEKLYYLNVSNNVLSSLPDSIDGLVNLIYLDVSYTKLERLPKNIGSLVKLQYLFLQGTELQSLPNSIGQLVNLMKLNVSQTKLQSLPNSIGLLVKLKYLDLMSTRIQNIPDSTDSLVNLKYLLMSKPSK